MLMIRGIGADLVDKRRIKEAVDRWGDRFLSRVFTAREMVQCRLKGDWIGSFAARFAAKEALLKALGTGWRGIGWKDVEVVSSGDGKPDVVLHREAGVLAKGCHIHLSLSHEQNTAMAVVVVESISD